MIGYVTIGTNKMADAATFYDELLGTIGAGRAFDTDTFIAWATGPQTPALSITKPFDGAPGMRLDNFDGGYFRDLDGNKLNTFCSIPEQNASVTRKGL